MTFHHNLTILYNNTEEYNHTSTFGAWDMAPTFIFCISGTLAVLGLIVNILHISVLYFNPPGRYLGAINNRLMLLHVAALDITVSAARIPLDSPAAQFYLQDNTWACALTAMIGYGAPLISKHILTLGCIDRLVVLKYGAKYNSSVFGRHFGKFFSLLYAYYSICLGVMIGINFKEVLRPRGFSICYLDVANSQALKLILILGVFTPLVISIGVYIFIVITVRRADSAKTHRSARFSYRMATFILIVLVTETICWMPAPLNVLLETSGKYNPILYHMGPMLVQCNTITKPFVYGFMSSSYRKFIRRYICRDSMLSISSTSSSGYHPDSKTSNM